MDMISPCYAITRDYKMHTSYAYFQNKMSGSVVGVYTYTVNLVVCQSACPDV